MVVVYSKPGCQPCRLTKKVLDDQGTEYVEKDVTADPEALRTVQELLSLFFLVFFVSSNNHCQCLLLDRLKQLASPS